MNNNKTVMKWSEMRNIAVTIPSEGITIGRVEDLYFKPGTNAVYALKVRLRLLGDRSLPVTGIRSVGIDAITIPSAEMLSERLPPLPLVGSLLTAKINTESGKDVGGVGEVLIGIDPPVAMRIVGFEMVTGSGRRSSHPVTLGADAVGNYGDGVVVITDTAAKRLR